MTPRRLSLVRAEAALNADGEDPRSPAADAKYLAGVRAADESAFRAMVAAYIVPLTRFAFGFVGEEDVAHDIVQDIFARVWQLGPDWDPHTGVAAYLFTSVRNRSFDTLKADRANKRMRESFRVEADVDKNIADDPYVDIALVSLVRRELDALTDRQRDALRLRYEHGHTMSQVAGILGIHQTAAEKLVARALSALRAKLASFREE